MLGITLTAATLGGKFFLIKSSLTPAAIETTIFSDVRAGEIY